MTIWMNGALRPAAFAIDANDRGFSIGDGAFETLLVRDGQTVFPQAHLVRLKAGLDLLRIEAAIELEELERAVGAICERDGISGDAAARLTITRGVGPRWTSGAESAPATIVITAEQVYPNRHCAPVVVEVSQYRRHAGAATARFKAIGGYGEHLLARRRAAENGYGDALMLNEFGRVACATTSNLFVIAADGTVATPPVGEGALPGVVRACLINGAAHHRVPIRETAIDIAMLEHAIIVLTSSIAGLRRGRLSTDEAPPTAEALGSLKSLEAWYEAQVKAELNAQRPPHAGARP